MMYCTICDGPNGGPLWTACPKCGRPAQTDEATPEVLAAQKAFNLSTGWYVAFPVGEHVVIVATPYQAERLAKAYGAFTASSNQAIRSTFAPVGLAGVPLPFPTDEPSRPGDGHTAG